MEQNKWPEQSQPDNNNNVANGTVDVEMYFA